ncbi:nucleoside diphosphate kinase homolog 7 isoform X2 [Oratosquilla oratoria]|uniref:nucleoside diphosphate kinase homolog 7 isoform X2 n=1 Tax=Oratosquilla oratoria TaxID=337810 RepID=UPI003F75D9B1
MNMNETKLVFHAKWYDPVSATVKLFLLSFFPRDGAVEMFDLRAQKLFLKRHVVDSLEERDFYVGNTVVVLSRQLEIIDYADSSTRNHIESQRQRTFAMVKPDAVHRIGEIIDVIQSRNFEVAQMKMVQLTREEAGEFYKEHQGRSFFQSLLDYITSGPVVALHLISRDAVRKWRTTLGPTDSNLARQDDPESIRAKFGKDKQSNAAHGSDSDTSANREIEFFFPSKKSGSGPKTTALLDGNTCCIIKPHAVANGHMGGILTAIANAGFKVSAMQMFRMDKIQAEEFLEVYKGIVNEYSGMIHQLISGPSVALEITSPGESEIPSKFREFVGPSDPAIAKELRPQSLRARFGEDKIRNAIHCSDLPEDGPPEVEYFFKILQ